MVDLKAKLVFDVVAKKVPIASKVSRPSMPTMHLESTFNKFWTYMKEKTISGNYEGGLKLLFKINLNKQKPISKYFLSHYFITDRVVFSRSFINNFRDIIIFSY